MKKYLKLLFVAIFATMTFALTACGDDDEPDGAPSKGNLDKYFFTVNGEKFYYAYDFYSLESDLNSGIVQFDETSFYKKKVIKCKVKGFNKVISFEDFTANASRPFKEGSGITSWAGLFIYLDYFDFETTKEGEELSVNDFTTYYETPSEILLGDVNENGSYNNTNQYEWTSRGNIQGKIKFVSFKDNLLTLKFENLTMPQKDGKSSATLSGTIVFDTENEIVLP